MKRFVSLLLGVVLIFSLSIPAFAAENDIKVTVDGRNVIFTDAQPFLDENNRTLIPVRFVSEAMEAEVAWNNDTRVATIVKGDTQVDITIGSKTLKVTKPEETSYVTMDTVAVIRNDRTYLPIRFVVEAFGGYVDWANVYNTVEILSCDGNMTAAEIKRLRTYSPIQYWYERKLKRTGYMKINDELDAIYGESFNKNYWFANAHHYLMNCCPESKKDVTDNLNMTVVKRGADEYTFTAAAIKFIETAAESKIDIPQKTGDPLVDFQNPLSMSSYNGWCQFKFRACEALAYHENSTPMDVINVRGVLDVTVNNNDCAKRFLTDVTERFGIQNPELGKTYSVDAEFVIGVDRWDFFYWLDGYTLDSGGNHIAWHSWNWG